MKLKKNIITMIMAVALAATTLTACGAKDEKPAETKAPEATQEAENEETPEETTAPEATEEVQETSIGQATAHA